MQVRIWGNKKKIATVKRTVITEIDNVQLAAISTAHEEDSEIQEEVVAVKRFMSIQKFDKFLK